jgi:hypothetical protein
MCIYFMSSNTCRGKPPSRWISSYGWMKVHLHLLYLMNLISVHSQLRSNFVGSEFWFYDKGIRPIHGACANG